MEKEFFLINCFDGRQIGFFSSVEQAKEKALDLFKRSRIKDRYNLWHLVELNVLSGVRQKFDDHYFEISDGLALDLSFNPNSYEQVLRLFLS